MKRKIGELYGKSIVEGDNNIITSNEISINSLDVDEAKLPFKKINTYVQLTPKDNSLRENTDEYNLVVGFLEILSTMVTYEGYLASCNVWSRLESYCPMDFTSYSFLIGYPRMYFEDDGDGHYISTLIESLDNPDELEEFLSEKFNIKYINLK